jgi:hypothetical protein
VDLQGRAIHPRRHWIPRPLLRLYHLPSHQRTLIDFFFLVESKSEFCCS